MTEPTTDPLEDYVTKNNIKTLTNLSTDPAFSAARNMVLQTLSESELTNVSRQLWEHDISRAGREAIAGIILDTLAQENNTRPALSSLNTTQQQQQQARLVSCSDVMAIPVPSDSMQVFPNLPESNFTFPADKSGHVAVIEPASSYNVTNIARNASEPPEIAAADITYLTFDTNVKKDPGAPPYVENFGKENPDFEETSVYGSAVTTAFPSSTITQTSSSKRSQQTLLDNRPGEPLKLRKISAASGATVNNHIRRPDTRGAPLSASILEVGLGPDRDTSVVASTAGVGERDTATNMSINDLRLSGGFRRSEFIPNLKWTVWTPNEDGGMWRCISELPDSVNADIRASFRQFCTSKPSRLMRYGKMARNPGLAVERGYCISKATSNSTTPTYTLANGDTKKACDSCIRLQRICVKLVKVHDIVKLGVYPLPQQEQKGATWKETMFWIQRP